MSEFLTNNIQQAVAITTDQIVERDIKTDHSKGYEPKMVANMLFGKLESFTETHLVISQYSGVSMEINRNNIVSIAEYNHNK